MRAGTVAAYREAGEGGDGPTLTFEATDSQTCQDAFHPVYGAGALADQVLALAVWPPRILLFHAGNGSVAICSVGARIVSSTPLGCFEFESCADELDYFSQCRGAKAKSSLDDAGFTTNVVCDVEGGCLSFTKCAHHLEALDRRIGRLQRLEAADRADQLLQLAVVSLDDVVQILDLSMQRFLCIPPPEAALCG